MSTAEDAPRTVFRANPLSTLFAVVFAVGAIPFAFGAPWFWVLYALPVGFVVWVLRRRTTVDPETVTARHLLRTRRVPWRQISSVRLRRARHYRGSGVNAVLVDGRELPLPAVAVRDLPALAAVSGGRLPGSDPSGAPSPVHPPQD